MNIWVTSEKKWFKDNNEKVCEFMLIYYIQGRLLPAIYEMFT